LSGGVCEDRRIIGSRKIEGARGWAAKIGMAIIMALRQ
jgi:hypothetical protein